MRIRCISVGFLVSRKRCRLQSIEKQLIEAMKIFNKCFMASILNWTVIYLDNISE